jgi:catechol 2,3-dioxygenase-like lactoylglutathione lyase family enzyme
MEDCPMPDQATPNLPSRDLRATSRFYAGLGFREAFRDQGWLIVRRGPLQIEFFPHAGLDPYTNIASCCLRVADARTLHAAFAAADFPRPAGGIPRITPPVDRPWGFREFAVVDPDGNLLRCLEPLGGDGGAAS